MMEGVMMIGQTQPQPQPQPQQPPPPASVVAAAAEKLNPAVQQQLNLESVRIRAVSLFKAISRIIDDFDAFARTSTNPKWQDVLGQYSMVNMELFNIVEEVRKASKAFLVHPKNVNADNSTVLPVMLSSKSLPEMESDDNSKREQLLHNMRHLPVANQIERLKARLDMIAAACESADKVLLETRKAYGFGTRQGPNIAPTLDKAQAAKIQEQESILRAAVNYGEGLRIPGDQRQITPSLPIHLTDVLNVGDGVHGLVDTSGMYQKNIPMSSNNLTNQGTLLQGSGTLHARSAASPGATSFSNTTASPLPYANSPNSGTNMNTPSPQQQPQLQQQTQQQQQALQRQKMMQLPQHQQQLLAQQQLRQTAMPGLGQMQFPQQLSHQQFPGRQLAPSHGIAQSQLNQANQINRHLSQFAGTANTALFNAAQTTQSTQMMPNMAATMQSQNLIPRMQFGLSGTNAQRSHASQILNDQMFNMGAASATGLMPMQQQQQAVSQGAFATMVPNPQTLQSSMGTLPNTTQGHPNFSQQRQPNQQ